MSTYLLLINLKCNRNIPTKRMISKDNYTYHYMYLKGTCSMVIQMKLHV